MCVVLWTSIKKEKINLSLSFVFCSPIFPGKQARENREWVTGIKSCSDQDKRKLSTIFHRATRLTPLTEFMDFFLPELTEYTSHLDTI